MSNEQQFWHGIASETIPWFPTVNQDTCIGCEGGFVTCGRGVYTVRGYKSHLSHLYDCMVGCTTRRHNQTVRDPNALREISISGFGRKQRD